MRNMIRKSAPRVVGGKPQRKNRCQPTPNCYNTRQDQPVVDRRRAGHGYRHYLRKRDVLRFLRLLPDWNELSRGLNVIQLAPGSGDCDGWHRPGVVAVCAWECEKVIDVGGEYFRAHERIFDRLGVSSINIGQDTYRCEFEDFSIRAYQLLHILLHELGHHHDRMTTRSKRSSSRGESFAEQYAIRYADRIWRSYVNEFER